jgi:hypothetical protein
MAMMDFNSDAVKLLLEKGAEVLGSGYEGTTVLMKPFLDNDTASRIYAGMEVENEDFAEKTDEAHDMMDSLLRSGGGDIDE